jgi:cyclic pyranopterin phosphate synthase
MRPHRTPRYLRISLLSACNLQCSYCLPPGKSRRTVLAPENKVRSALRFLHRSGIRKIRFTGGEPTLYSGLGGLVSYVKSLDKDVHTAVTSNGVLLATGAKVLADAGLDSINISLDTLDRKKFHALTSRDCLKQVISGIDAATEYIAHVKLNTVLMRGVNDDEVGKLIAFAGCRGLPIRFIEFMPNQYSAPNDPRFISSEEIRRRLGWDFQPKPEVPNSAAQYFQIPTQGIDIGFISPVSHPFCNGCDRVRLAANGDLYSCLYESTSINLFDLMEDESGSIHAEFANLIRSKQFGGLHNTCSSSATLPSLSAIGG